MNNATSVSVEVGGKNITIETGLLALQAAGASLVTLGDTLVFSAVTTSKETREGIDYFPLQVEYREKYYAAGRFPGGYVKRETRPSEKEVLTARLTDRPIRPLFPQSFRNDVQINNMLMSFDGQNDSDILSLIAASAALVLSELPFAGPVGAVRVARVDGKFVVNPTNAEREQSDLDLVYAALDKLPIMIEGSGREVSEEDLVAAMKIAHDDCRKIIAAQLELRRKMGLPDKTFEQPAESPLVQVARDLAVSDLRDTLQITDRKERKGRVEDLRTALHAKLLAQFPEMTKGQFADVLDVLEIESLRANVLDKKARPDGRGFDELRPLAASVGILPRTHGSSLFNRGDTQALACITLGAQSDSQRLDAIAGGATEKKFMFHYNFPPYSVGEAGRLGSTSRREIGHGALAERSVAQVIPSDYPYTVRLVSEIMGSNGSSSMASVCAGSLALMDAGVPISGAVAGIAIGLVSDEKQAHLLVDIAGAEDHCGDMDFKVAGTRKGVTGFQVDLKIRGLRWDLVEEAFRKARTARLQVLDHMDSVLAATRPEMSPYAPRIVQVKIDPEKIGELIGPGGKNIRRITDLSGAQIDIDDDGMVNILATSQDSMNIAVAEVNAIAAEVEVDQFYDGKVVGITTFGAFVEVLPGKDGLVHISELADFRVNKVEDVCKVGDSMRVKCIAVDDRGRVKLSRRQAMNDDR